MRQLVQLQKDSEKFKEAGLLIIGISYDSTETLKAFAEKQNITFPLLSDEGSKTIDAYDIRNKDADDNERIAGIPHPGTFIVDDKGIVTAKLFRTRYAYRHSTEELLEAAKEKDEKEE